MPPTVKSVPGKGGIMDAINAMLVASPTGAQTPASVAIVPTKPQAGLSMKVRRQEIFHLKLKNSICMCVWGVLKF